jgi:4-hydroxybenzoate polyprenyltransferase
MDDVRSGLGGLLEEEAEVERRLVSAGPPLAVDLDGTLIAVDSLHESCVDFAKGSPRELPTLLAALRHGKAAFKRAVAAGAPFDPALLPYNEELLNYLRAERRTGRRIGLFTAADQSVADAVAEHLGLFDVAQGSDGVVNLSGERKLAAIEQAFGPRFSYAGNGRVDLPIFRRAATVLLAGPVEQLQAALPPGTVVEAKFPDRPTGLRVWAKALRLQHWVKNALIFVAPALAPQPLALVADAVALFVLMGVLASATYLVNDLFDLAADRRHPVKRFRPLADGRISARSALLAAAAMVAGSLAASLALPDGCTLALLIYLFTTLAYSFGLKRVPMIDVTILAGLFTLRVLAGSLLVPAPIAPWLLTFSMLFFLGLAMVKRYAELERVVRTTPGGGGARGYTGQDLPILLATGVATGISAIVVFMLYLINEQYPRTIYHNPSALWGVMPVLLIWTLRVWHLTVHGRMNEDPVVFALKDRLSLALGCAVAVILVLARW